MGNKKLYDMGNKKLYDMGNKDSMIWEIKIIWYGK